MTAPAGPTDSTVQGQLSDSEAAEVLSVADAAEAQDGIAPVSEQGRLAIRYGAEAPARSLLLRQGGELAGFAHLELGGQAQGWSGELVIHPARRGRGLGRALALAAAAEAGSLPLALWAHGDLPAAARLAAAVGFTPSRSLWLMHRSLASALPADTLPAGVRVRTFVPGRDERDWLALNGRAFAGHPEQGRWTLQDVDRREHEPWFDPGGFFLAERDATLVGFHWTKVHQPPARRPDASPVGEVYVLGVDPAEQGGGLGRALTLVGLHHLREQGLPGVMLYVEGDNTPAIRLYESLGFLHTATDVMYRAPAKAPRS